MCCWAGWWNGARCAVSGAPETFPGWFPAYRVPLTAYLFHRIRSTNAPKNTTILTIPFAVKNAALSFDKSPGFT